MLLNVDTLLEIFFFLDRLNLDACQLVSRQWNGLIQKQCTRLALHGIVFRVSFLYMYFSKHLSFIQFVADGERPKDKCAFYQRMQTNCATTLATTFNES